MVRDDNDEDLSSRESRFSSLQESTMEQNHDDLSQNSDDIFDQEPDTDSMHHDPNLSTNIDRIELTGNYMYDENLKNHVRSQRLNAKSGLKYGSEHGRKIQFYHPSDGVISVMYPADPTKVSYPSIESCKCTRSRCLMLYCDCFQAGQICSPSCVCISCRNTRSQSKPGGLRHIAIETILWRRPDAFEFKAKKVDEGCKCKKNRYECFF